MATIKERAKKHFPDILDDDCTIPTPAEYIIEEKRQIYILGATEQKAIDIENACKACENKLRRLKALLNESGSSSSLISVGKSLSNIRKEMQE